MFGWIAYVRKNRILARLEELEERVKSMHERQMRRESAEDMRTLRASRKAAGDAGLLEEAATILHAAGKGQGSQASGAPSVLSKQELYRKGMNS